MRGCIGPDDRFAAHPASPAEARGLIEPKRSPKGTRLYSHSDVERLRRIQQMTAEGLNLVGVERVLELEHRLRELEGGSDAAG